MPFSFSFANPGPYDDPYYFSIGSRTQASAGAGAGIAAVPEPSTYGLMLAGLVALIAVARKRVPR